LRVLSVRDLGSGLDTAQSDHRALLPWKPGDNFISFALEGNAVLTLRASGTEPKLKYYLEAQGDSQEAAEQVARELEADMMLSILQPSKYGLTAHQAADQ
jgi:phosphomannomutase